MCPQVIDLTGIIEPFENSTRKSNLLKVDDTIPVLKQGVLKHLIPENWHENLLRMKSHQEKVIGLLEIMSQLLDAESATVFDIGCFLRIPPIEVANVTDKLSKMDREKVIATICETQKFMNAFPDFRDPAFKVGFYNEYNSDDPMTYYNMYLLGLTNFVAEARILGNRFIFNQ